MDKKISEIFDYSDGIAAVEERDDLFDPDRIRELTMRKIQNPERNSGDKPQLKKARPVYRTVLIAAVIVAALIGTALAISRLPIFADDPILHYYLKYLTGGVAMEDPGIWSEYVYFPDEASRAAAESTYIPVVGAFVQESERLSDDLWAFAAFYQETKDGDGRSVVQFCGRYDGRLYVFPDEGSVPEELRGALSQLTLTPVSADGFTESAKKLNEFNELIAGFLGSEARAEAHIADGFPLDETAEPKLLSDYLLNPNDWEFRYDDASGVSDLTENESVTAIKVYDPDGNILWIRDGADALMITKPDGSVIMTISTQAGLDTADMINHLLPWARGEYTMLDWLQEIREESGRITQEVLAMLGDHGPAGQEDCMSNVTGEENDQTFYGAMKGLTESLYAGVSKYYNFKTDTVYWACQLCYGRYWSDSTRAESITSDVFDELDEIYRSLYGTFRDDITVCGQEAYAWNMMRQQTVMWYDAERDLIFSVLSYADDYGSIDEPLLEKMAALAETVD